MTLRWWLAVAAQLCLVASAASAQLESPCVKDSPERRGELGCSIVEIKPLLPSLSRSLYWHIDRFATGDLARAAVTPTSIALEAHGSWWLLSVEPDTHDHHGGKHVAEVKLPPLPVAEKYSMLVISAYVASGLTSRIHRHSGVEGFYVVDGAQCLETETRADTMRTGQGMAVGTNVVMRLVAIGPVPRRALAVVVYDASQPPTTRMETGPALVPCM
jgi:quercetin dioxygenase-like cupin family protein